MRILTNQKIRMLFIQIGLCMLLFTIFMTGMIFLELSVQAAALCMTLAAVLTGVTVLAFCYRYFRQQDRVLEEAVAGVREFIAGSHDVRLMCNEEGELYRLFHEVNSLAAILNAKVEKEGEQKLFLRNTMSDISHQLKTPLAALNIYNGIMQTEAGTNDLTTIREFTALSEQELDRIETLVQNLLKITKFDAGSIVMEKHPENVAEMMADVKRHFAFRAAQEGKEIVLSGDASLFFLCDRNWIVEALSNIVKNALDHTESGNCVLIEWGQSVQAVRIKIRDDGCGIHPEDLHHIFKRFYRSRYSKDTQGIGLGLPLAKSVVEGHNGTIEVESRLGEGTAFMMNFLIPTKL